MKLWSKKPTNTAQSIPNQRVRSYYTASKKQINNFQRTGTNHGMSTAKQSYISKSYLLRGVFTVALLVAVGALITLTTTPRLDFSEGPPYRSTQEYDKIIQPLLAKNPTDRVKVSFNGAAVADAIKQQLPEATQVDAYAPVFGRNPEILIQTAPPFATVIQPDGPTLVLNNRGKLVATVGSTTVDTTNIATITNQSGTIFTVGDQLFKPDEMQAMLSLQFQYTNGSQQGIVSYVLPAVPREIHTSEGSYIAKFSLAAGLDIVQQYGALKAVQEQLRQAGQTPQSYIDVRLADKVFIK